jgi:hypothetical protein
MAYGVADLILTSPPYACEVADLNPVSGPEPLRRNDTTNYSRDRRNLGHARGSAYLVAMDDIYRACAEVLKPGGFLVCVTKDMRSGGGGALRNLSSETIALCEGAGLIYWQRAISLLATVRDSELVMRPSFWQTLHARRRREKGDRTHVVAHEGRARVPQAPDSSVQSKSSPDAEGSVTMRAAARARRAALARRSAVLEARSTRLVRALRSRLGSGLIEASHASSTRDTASSFNADPFAVVFDPRPLAPRQRIPGRRLHDGGGRRTREMGHKAAVRSPPFGYAALDSCAAGARPPAHAHARYESLHRFRGRSVATRALCRAKARGRLMPLNRGTRRQPKWCGYVKHKGARSGSAHMTAWRRSRAPRNGAAPNCARKSIPPRSARRPDRGQVCGRDD